MNIASRPCKKVNLARNQKNTLDYILQTPEIYVRNGLGFFGGYNDTLYLAENSF